MAICCIVSAPRFQGIVLYDKIYLRVKIKYHRWIVIITLYDNSRFDPTDAKIDSWRVFVNIIYSKTCPSINQCFKFIDSGQQYFCFDPLIPRVKPWVTKFSMILWTEPSSDHSMESC